MSHPNTWDILTLAQIAKAADHFAVIDATDGVTKRIVASQILDRLLSTDSIDWMSGFDNFAALATGDKLPIFDASGSAYKYLLLSELMNRLLSSTDLSWMDSFANLAAVDGSSDTFLLKDATTGGLKQLSASEILQRLSTLATITAHTSDATLDNSANYSLRTNKGATDTVTITLWEPDEDDEITFTRVADEEFRIAPHSGGAFNGGGTDKYFALLTPGQVRFRAFEDGVFTPLVTPLWEFQDDA